MARLTNHGRKKTHFLRTVQTLTRVKKVGLSGCVKASVWQAACAVLNDSQCAFKFKLSKKVETYITPKSKAIGLLRKHRSCAPLVKILDLLFKKGVMRRQQLMVS